MASICRTKTRTLLYRLRATFYAYGVLNLCAGSLVCVGQPQTGGVTAKAAPVASQAVASKPSAPKGAQRGGFHEPDPIDWNDHDGYQQIFDGVSLKNWVGDPSVWHVENGVIVGESTKEKPVGNSYISFHGFEAKDFDLKLEIKVVNGGGSGIQYRSQTGIPWRRQHPQDAQPNLAWMMTGPQADFWSPAFPDRLRMDRAVLLREHPSGDPRVARASGRFFSREKPSTGGQHRRPHRPRRLHKK
jgi:hypothetical protein